MYKVYLMLISKVKAEKRLNWFILTVHMEKKMLQVYSKITSISCENYNA